MRYTGPAGIHLSESDVRYLYAALLHDNTGMARELRRRFGLYLDARDMDRHCRDGGTPHTWTPPLHKVIE